MLPVVSSAASSPSTRTVPKLDKFIAADPETKAVGDSHDERVKALRDAVFSLAMDIAIHTSELPARGEIPIPILTLELSTNS